MYHWFKRTISKKWFKKSSKPFCLFFFLHYFLLSSELTNFHDLTSKRLFYLIAHFQELEHKISQLKLSKEIANQIDNEGVMTEYGGEISSKGLRPLSYAAKVYAPDQVFIFLLKNGADPLFKEDETFEYIKTENAEFCCWPFSLLYTEKKTIHPEHAVAQIRKLWEQATPKTKEYRYILNILERITPEHPSGKPYFLENSHKARHRKNQVTIINDKQAQSSFFSWSPQSKKKELHKPFPQTSLSSKPHNKDELLIFSRQDHKRPSPQFFLGSEPEESDDELLPF